MSYDRDDNADMVEVSGELRQDRDASWAIWCGDMTDDADGKGKEIWVFLPKSCCEQGDNKNTWMVPSWLAKDKDLI